MVEEPGGGGGGRGGGERTHAWSRGTHHLLPVRCGRTTGLGCEWRSTAFLPQFVFPPSPFLRANVIPSRARAPRDTTRSCHGVNPPRLNPPSPLHMGTYGAGAGPVEQHVAVGGVFHPGQALVLARGQQTGLHRTRHPCTHSHPVSGRCRGARTSPQGRDGVLCGLQVAVGAAATSSTPPSRHPGRGPRRQGRCPQTRSRPEWAKTS